MSIVWELWRGLSEVIGSLTHAYSCSQPSIYKSRSPNNFTCGFSHSKSEDNWITLWRTNWNVVLTGNQNKNHECPYWKTKQKNIILCYYWSLNMQLPCIGISVIERQILSLENKWKKKQWPNCLDLIFLYIKQLNWQKI